MIDLEVKRMELFIVKNNYNDEEVKYYLEIQEKIADSTGNNDLKAAVEIIRKRLS